MTGTAATVPRHVVLVVIDLSGGGTQRIVAGLARALRDAGTCVTIITNRTSDGRWGDLHATADVVELRGQLRVEGSSRSPSFTRNVRWLISAAREIRSVLQAVEPGTAVLAFLPGTNVLTSLARLGVDVPLVLSERNDFIRQPLPALIRIARRILYRTATVVTTNRPDDLETLRALSGTVPVRLVSNPRPSFACLASPSTSRRIVTAGRLTAHKRHRDVVLAFGALAEEFPAWTLRVLGDGPERSALEKLVGERGLTGRVELLGWSSDVAEELVQGAVLVHASEYEGASNAVLEAMAAGLPVVASAPSVPWPAASGIAAGVGGVQAFATGDIATLVRSLRDLMRDAELRDRRGEEASRAVRTITADPLSAWLPVISCVMRT